MTLILFICRGNTCRSPMAEITARAGGFTGTRFASAGVAVTAPGGPADLRAIDCVAAVGLDLRQHRTRAVSVDLLAPAQRIFALDRSVRDSLFKTLPAIVHPRIALLLDLVPSLGLHDVADPWSGTAADYAHAFDLIQQAVAALRAEKRRDQ